jgi:hypothetical protein
LPELLRRVAALTVVSVIGIGVLAPLTVRSALPETNETMRLLDAAEAPPTALSRAAVSGREFSAALSLLDQTEPLSVEALTAPGAMPPTPASISMRPVVEARSTPRPTPSPRPVPRSTSASSAPRSTTVDGSVWDRLAQCESGGNWSINTGNGYYGGLQFNYATWHAYGGGQYADYPHQASREQQIATAERLHAHRGFQPWPSCRIKLGLP